MLHDGILDWQCADSVTSLGQEQGGVQRAAPRGERVISVGKRRCGTLSIRGGFRLLEGEEMAQSAPQSIIGEGVFRR